MIALLLLLLATLIILLAMRGCSSTDRKQTVEATVIEAETDTTNLIVAPAPTTAKKQNQSKKQSGQRLPDGRSRRHLDERVD